MESFNVGIIVDVGVEVRVGEGLAEGVGVNSCGIMDVSVFVLIIVGFGVIFVGIIVGVELHPIKKSRVIKNTIIKFFFIIYPYKFIVVLHQAYLVL